LIVIALACMTAPAAWAQPGQVSGLAVSVSTPYSKTLTWTAYDSSDFAAYKISMRKTSAATYDSVGALDVQTTDSYAITGLTPYTAYDISVAVIDTGGAEGLAVELINQRTPALYFPHADSVTASNINFTPSGTWTVVENGPGEGDAYTGTYHWSDSPGGNYAPSMDQSLTMTIDLGTAIMPVLTFYERYSYQTNVDYGYVEISTNGSSWSRVAFNTGSQTVWARKEIDLTQWAGSAEVRIKFRSTSNASTESDGWRLDDFAVTELAPKTLPYPFVDDFETDSTNNWVASSWSLMTDSHTPTNALHDSRMGNYPAEAWNPIVSDGVFDLSGAVNPVLTFWHKYSFIYQDNCCWSYERDYGRVYVSADHGRPGSWVSLAAYTSSQPDWTRAQLNLTQFAGASTVRIMFVVDDNTESSGRPNDLSSGWWIDDIRVEELPEPVSLSPIVSSSMHHVELNWTQNTDADFSHYEIRRATSADVSRSSSLIATIDNAATITFIDSVAMIEPTHYSYRMYVIDVLGDISLGSEIQTATYDIPSNLFPFADSMAVDTDKWAWGAPWGPTTATYHSAPSSWTDSPGASYGPNSSTALTTVVNLNGSNEPVLTFWHRYALQTNADYGHVEISADGGATWSELMRVTGIDTTWTSERIDLGENVVGATIGLRFRLSSNGDTHLDGWYVDDIEIRDGTRKVAFPWTDDVESGVGSWFADSPWSISDVNSRSGSHHWTDSPAGSYRPNENTSLTFTIDLSGPEAKTAVLRFWERYSFQPNADWGFVEVSTNQGDSWTMEYAVTGSSADWRQDEIDLSPYWGSAQVSIRYRVMSNSSAESDGWHIDDLEIASLARDIPYPFVESFDDTTAPNRWLTSSWEFVTNGRSGPYRLHDSPDGNYHTDVWSSLTLAGTIDLSNLSEVEYPVMTFWHQYSLISQDNCCWSYEDDYARVYVSPDNGQVWYEVAKWTGSTSGWTKATINLFGEGIHNFVGASELRVRFVLDDNTESSGRPNDVANGWWIDDIRIEELPAPVALSPIVGSTQHHATANWTLNADGDFDRYEVYRATTTEVTRSSLLVASIDNQSTTSWTDTFAVVQPTHYSYRMYVVDTLSNVSPASNVETAGYAIPQVSFPFADSMNVDSPNWSWGDPWGPTTDAYHSAPASWKTGPSGVYPPNANTALTTQLSLSSSDSTVLTFWHRYAFEAGIDFGRVEVLPEGSGTWVEVLRVTGVDNTWASERVDLGAYAGIIGLRFRVNSNGSNQFAGWYIDDVSVAKGARSVKFPWSDDAE